MERCELTYRAREPIDLELARAQHRAYEECLAGLGCAIRQLPAAPDLPDAVFVEDAAVVLDELAVIARPGAASRRAETPAVAEALGEFRDLRAIEEPGTLEGGDVLRVGRALYVGTSGRTNPAGIAQLAAHIEPFGYRVQPVTLQGCLHLKSGASLVAADTLLIQRGWVDARAFEGLELVDVSPGERDAANALLVGQVVVLPAAFPETRRRLERRGIEVRVLDVSEAAKAEGGVTCCSLLVTR